jgi:carbon-monoxide dehydrogenase medium subunit
MKLGPIRYERPADLVAAAGLLRTSDGAVALAGGQSLLPALRLGDRSADQLVDLSHVPALRGIEEDGVALTIGAGEPMWSVERSPLVAAAAPLLVRVLGSVGAASIRSRATLGGSLAWADPTSQLPATLIALDATVETTERSVPASALQTGRHRTSLRRGELIVRVQIPKSGAAGGFAMIRRTHITWPAVGAVASRTGSGDVRLVLFGAAPRPVLLSDDGAGSIQAAIDERISPFDDERASSWYRRAVVGTLAGRALAELPKEAA